MLLVLKNICDDCMQRLMLQNIKVHTYEKNIGHFVLQTPPYLGYQLLKVGLVNKKLYDTEFATTRDFFNLKQAYWLPYEPRCKNFQMDQKSNYGQFKNIVHFLSFEKLHISRSAAVQKRNPRSLESCSLNNAGLNHSLWKYCACINPTDSNCK